MAGNFYKLYDQYVTNKKTSEQIQADLDELLTATFEAHPTLKAIIFHGRTPAWMDGETCYHNEEITLICDDGWIDNACASEYSFDHDELELKYGEKASSMIGKVLMFYGEESVYVELPIDIGNNPGKARGMEKVEEILKVQKFTHWIHDTDYVLSVIRTDKGYDINSQACWDQY